MNGTTEKIAVLLIPVGLAAGCKAPPPPQPAKLDDVFILDQVTRVRADGKVEEIEGGVLVTWTGLDGRSDVTVTATGGERTYTATPLPASGSHAALFEPLPLGSYELVIDSAELNPPPENYVPLRTELTVKQEDIDFKTVHDDQVPDAPQPFTALLTFPDGWWPEDGSTLDPEIRDQMQEVSEQVLRRFCGDVLVCSPVELERAYRVTGDMEGQELPSWAKASSLAVVDLRWSEAGPVQLVLRLYDLETRALGKLWGGLPLVFQDAVELARKELDGVPGTDRHRNRTRELIVGMRTLLEGLGADPLGKRYLEHLDRPDMLPELLGLVEIESLEASVFGVENGPGTPVEAAAENREPR
jgi:hypothetical protein